MGEIGDVVKKRLAVLGMKQKELATKANISPAYLSQVLNGQRKLAAETANQLSHILGISLTDEPVDVTYNRLYADYLAEQKSVEQLIAETNALRKAVTDTESDTYGRVLLLLCKLYHDCKDRSNCVSVGVEAHGLFRELGDKLSWAEALYYVASVENFDGRYEYSLPRFEFVEQTLTRIGYIGHLLSRTYCGIAVAHSAMGNFDKMCEYVKKCEDTIEGVPASEQASYRARRSYVLAYSLLENGSYNDAIGMFKRSQYEYEYVNDVINALAMAHNIAEVHYRTGNVDEAYSMLLKIYDRKKQCKTSNARLAYTANMIAQISYERQNFSEASKYCQEVIGLTGVQNTEYAQAYRVIARIEGMKNGIQAFNHYMCLAMQKLRHGDGEEKMLNQIVKEYALKNDLPIGS